MGNRIVSALLATCLALLASGCSDDSASQDGYKGVGQLVADRNTARLANSADRKNQESGSEAKPQPLQAKRSKPTEVITEEEVTIVSRSSGEILAGATVFLDKNGNIITIKIKKD